MSTLSEKDIQKKLKEVGKEDEYDRGWQDAEKYYRVVTRLTVENIIRKYAPKAQDLPADKPWYAIREEDIPKLVKELIDSIYRND